MLSDVSGNDDYIDLSDSESELLNESNESIQTVVVDSPDYSVYFENLQCIGIVLILLLIGFIVSNSFLRGFKR